MEDALFDSLFLNLKVLILEEKTSLAGSAFQIVTIWFETKHLRVCVCYALPEVQLI